MCYYKTEYHYNYHNSAQYPLSCLLFKKLRYGKWILRTTAFLNKIQDVG
jgi:hypothetical protein